MSSNHLHEHTHDPDCSCGCHGENLKERNEIFDELRHSHHHSPDCDCGCHDHASSEAENIANSALKFSKKADVLLSGSVSVQELEDTIGNLLMEAGKRVCEGGSILGHIKALLGVNGSSVSFSITRIGTIDKTYMGIYEPANRVSEYSLTVNILSLLNTDAILDDIIKELYKL